VAGGVQCDIVEEFEGAEFGDQRLNRRLAQLGSTMAGAPARSFPGVLSDAALEAAYRFFGNVKVDPGAILHPHVRQTLGRIAGQEVVLVAHDSSTISFNSEGEREGLTVARGTKQSFLTHCSLAIRADGTRRPEGVLFASYHVPTEAQDGVLQDRWGDHVRNVHALGLSPTKVIHLMDREADDYEVLDLLCHMGGRFVIRVQHNRRVEEGRLRDVLDTTNIYAEREIPLSKRSGKVGPKQRKIHPSRKSRKARVAISATTISILRNPRAVGPLRETLTLNVVRVWEPEPPAGEPPVEWLLYTSEPIETAEQILQIVDWYRARWTIEEYFKALKTGCALEERQLGDFYALTNATALFLPIAWKLLLLKSEAAARPLEPAATVLDADELDVLRLTARKPLPEAPTTSDVMLAIGALGGHLKHNGQPGWQTLARGYNKLQALVEGWNLRRSVETGWRMGQDADSVQNGDDLMRPARGA
jgi:hypothetical protein